jgi:hypothetical protein
MELCCSYRLSMAILSEKANSLSVAPEVPSVILTWFSGLPKGNLLLNVSLLV